MGVKGNKDCTSQSICLRLNGKKCQKGAKIIPLILLYVNI